MTPEQKDLLIKDLFTRIPYDVKVNCNDKIYNICGIQGFNICCLSNENNVNAFTTAGVKYIKPYLFPLSSITNKQMEELEELCDMYTPDDDYNPYAYLGIKVLYKHVLDDGYKFKFKTDVIDWFNKNHLDYRGLIDMGLAIDCTNLNIY